MEIFLISIERSNNGFMAQFSDGANIELAANDYTDAVLESDHLVSELNRDN